MLVILLASVCFTAHATDIVTTDSQVQVSGAVDDPSGATVSGAKVELLDSNGSLVASATTLLNGQFRIAATPGDYQLAIIRDGFATSVSTLHLHDPVIAPLLIKLKIAELSQQVNVDASVGSSATDPSANQDTTTVTAGDLKSIPVFDNDYIAALSTMLDAGDISTGGTTILVDGVEKNRVGVSNSAVQSVKINNDPYSAEFYQPGRGQIQIITKPTVDAFHGSLNFDFRDGIFDARNAFAPPGPKPPEQRRIYFGDLTGPIFHLKDTSFLFSFTRAEEDLQAVVNAVTPSGPLQQNVAAPTRNTELSMRVSRQLSPAQTAYVEYQYQNQSNINEGVGELVLAAAGSNTTNVESDFVFHDDYILSPTRLNQLSALVEINRQDNTNANQGPKIVVQGAFVGGSAQAQQVKSEYNLRLTDTFSYTHGRHQLKFGVNLPHIGRRVLEDQSLFGGEYVFPSLAAYQANRPSTYESQQGQSRYIYHDLEAGVFVLDVIQATPTLTITPGLRYDWNNFTRSLANFSPRFSVAKLLDKDGATVLRAGAGVYYDRAGNTPLADVKRYSQPSLFDTLVTDSPCFPVICPDQITLQAPNVVRLAPDILTPLRFNLSVSLEHRVGKAATASVAYYKSNSFNAYRSVDVNAPIPFFGSTVRPNPAFGRYRQIESAGNARSNSLTLMLRGRISSVFSGTAQYIYAHAIDNTGGIGFYPQNQYLPDNEEASANYDARHRFNMFATFGQGKPLNLGVQVHISNGTPYTITTGTDPYGTGFFNARPAGVARNSKNNPMYQELDLRYGYDFKMRPKKQDKSPTIGFSLSAFNVINRLNPGIVSSVVTSPTFGQVTAAYPPRRMQLELRYTF
jgi:hypothetical protein